MHLESQTDTSNSNLSSLSFEDALAGLQEVVAQLESDSLSLDETIANFKRGSELAARCQKLITEAELRVTELAQIQDEPTPIGESISHA